MKNLSDFDEPDMDIANEFSEIVVTNARVSSPR